MEKLLPYLISGRFVIITGGEVLLFLNGNFISRKGDVFQYQNVEPIKYISDFNVEFLVDGSDFWDEEWIKNNYVYYHKETKVIQLFTS